MRAHVLAAVLCPLVALGAYYPSLHIPLEQWTGLEVWQRLIYWAESTPSAAELEPSLLEISSLLTLPRTLQICCSYYQLISPPTHACLFACQVRHWLVQNELDELVPLFKNRSISGSVLQVGNSHHTLSHPVWPHWKLALLYFLVTPFSFSYHISRNPQADFYKKNWASKMHGCSAVSTAMYESIFYSLLSRALCIPSIFFCFSISPSSVQDSAQGNRRRTSTHSQTQAATLYHRRRATYLLASVRLSSAVQAQETHDDLLAILCNLIPFPLVFSLGAAAKPIRDSATTPRRHGWPCRMPSCHASPCSSMGYAASP